MTEEDVEEASGRGTYKSQFEERGCPESSKIARRCESYCIKSEVNLATPVNEDKPRSKLKLLLLLLLYVQVFPQG